MESAVQNWTEDTKIHAWWTLFAPLRSVKEIDNYGGRFTRFGRACKRRLGAKCWRVKYGGAAMELQYLFRREWRHQLLLTVMHAEVTHYANCDAH
jgi:hypothetical protein